MRKVAAHHIELPDGTVLHQEVVVIDDNGNIISHHKLQHEEPYVEWFPGTVRL